jgi:hypothetical protein
MRRVAADDRIDKSIITADRRTVHQTLVLVGVHDTNVQWHRTSRS